MKSLVSNISICLTIVLAVSNISFGQKTLILEKIGSKKRIRYEIGDNIQFQLIESDGLSAGTVTNYNDSMISVNNMWLPIADIERVYIGKERTLIRLLSGLGKLGALGISALTLINGTTQGFDKIHKGPLIIAPSALAFGLLIPLTERKWFKPDKNHRIRVIDHSPV